MRNWRIVFALLTGVLLLAMVSSFKGCGGGFDKVELANLLTGFVLDQLEGQEIGAGRESIVGATLAKLFLGKYGDRIPARLHDDVERFAALVIPAILAKFGVKLPDGAIMLLGPQGGDNVDGFELGIREFVLAEYVSFEGGDSH